MKIAIIGAGFAGLATAFYLSKLNPPNEITLFDHLGIGGKASGIAAGLLHPYSGRNAKLNRFGMEGYSQASELIQIAEKAYGQKVFHSSGLLRVALTKSQVEDFENCSRSHENVYFLAAEECQKLVPGLLPYPGILIKDAKTVYSKPYLQGLFLACKESGITFENNKISTLSELNYFDHVVVSAGADTKFFKEIEHIKMSFVKGQVLELEWPDGLPILNLPVNSQVYLLMTEDKKRCIAGATFERNFESDQKDENFAISEIMPKVVALIPALKNAKIVDCKSAVRVSTKDHLPLIQKIDDKLSIFTGLGSKGLLYHALYAKKLAETIIYSK